MMKNQLAGLMKQAQAMQENMKKAQDEIAALEVEGAAGAGLVKVVMTGRHDVKRVHIDATLLAEDKDVLEDLVAAAVNDAVRKGEAASQSKMAGMTAGLPLPPGFKLPFGWRHLGNAVEPRRADAGPSLPPRRRTQSAPAN